MNYFFIIFIFSRIHVKHYFFQILEKNIELTQFGSATLFFTFNMTLNNTVANQ
jgi:hypothetical protein